MGNTFIDEINWCMIYTLNFPWFTIDFR